MEEKKEGEKERGGSMKLKEEKGREGRGFDGVGNKGEKEVAEEGKGDEKVVEGGIGVGLSRKERRLSRTFSSWRSYS